MIPIEIIAFLIGHITGWGEGAGRQKATMRDLLISGIGSALISFVLIALIGLGVPQLSSIQGLVGLIGELTTLPSILFGSAISGFTAFVGTFFGYYARQAQEELQAMY